VIDEDAFKRAGTPGRGSTVGDFVPGKNGGWVPRDHPDAMPAEPTPNKASLPTEDAAPAPAAPASGGGGGGDLSGMALGGLSQARQPLPNVEGFKELSAPGAANPMLGQRVYPMAMRQLAMQAPRVY
jgi:hypothetical protein